MRRNSLIYIMCVTFWLLCVTNGAEKIYRNINLPDCYRIFASRFSFLSSKNARRVFANQNCRNKWISNACWVTIFEIIQSIQYIVGLNALREHKYSTHIAQFIWSNLCYACKPIIWDLKQLYWPFMMYYAIFAAGVPFICLD